MLYKVLIYSGIKPVEQFEGMGDKLLKNNAQLHGIAVHFVEYTNTTLKVV